METPSTTRTSSWPHRWAWGLACATFPLIWWGGLVTATGSGMAFRDWLTSDGTFMLSYPWLNSAGDKFIEHGHRLLGALAGVLAIGLAAVCTVREPRRWVRSFSYLLLVGVVLQGALGGMRVLIDRDNVALGRLLALVHGCTGPLFFTLCIAMVVVTSRRWQSPDESSARDASRKVCRVATACALLAYLQLVVGAVVRHSKLMISEHADALFRAAVYFHILLAAMVTLHIFLLLLRSWRLGVYRKSAAALALLIAMQILLGASTWFALYGMPRWATTAFGEVDYVNVEASVLRSGIVTVHGAVGALIVAVVAAIALMSARRGGVRPKASLHVPSSFAGALA